MGDDGEGGTNPASPTPHHKPSIPPRPEGLKLKLKPELSFRTRPVSARSFSAPPKRTSTNAPRPKEFENLDLSQSSDPPGNGHPDASPSILTSRRTGTICLPPEDEDELFLHKGESLLTNADWERTTQDTNYKPILKGLVGFNIELGKKQFSTLEEILMAQQLFLEDFPRHAHPYAQFFFGKSHINYITLNEDESPTVVTIETPQTKDVNSVKALIKTKERDERLVLTGTTSKERLKSLKKLQEKLQKMKLYRVEDPELPNELKTMEERLVSEKYKFGVLFAGNERDENAMFANQSDPTGQFDDFLEFLGDKIQLSGWSSFRGGLDVKGNTTGTHSIYTLFEDVEIMFHVSTLLPYDPTPGSQQLERKRHLGNDIVVIVFVTGDAPFEPTTLTSHFNHAFVIVRPEAVVAGVVMSWRVEIACKVGVPPCRPYLPYPPIFERTDDFRDWFLTKLLNLERVSMHAPEFEQKELRTRKILLKNLSSTFAKKENHKLFDVSAFLMDFFGWTEKKKY